MSNWEGDTSDNTKVADVLSNIVKDYGKEVFYNKQKIIGLIADYMPNMSRDRKILGNVINESIPTKLLKVNDSDYNIKQLVINDCINQMEEEYGTKREVAEYAISCIVKSLNWVNLGDFGSQMNNQQAQPAGGAVPILNLKKNDILDLTKRNPGLKNVILGAGWDVAENGQSFDLDIAAFMLDANSKVNSIKNVIFFSNKNGQGISLNGYNRTGSGEGDDERIEIHLDQINPAIQKIVFVVSIFEAQIKRQTFGMVNNSYVRLLDMDKNESEICHFNLKEDGSTATSVIFAELFRQGTEWQFKAVGEGKIADLNDLFALYQ